MKYLVASLVCYLYSFSSFSQIVDKERCFYYNYTAHVSTIDTNKVWKDQMILVIKDGITVFESYSNFRRNSEIKAMKERNVPSQEFAANLNKLPRANFKFALQRNYNKQQHIYTDKIVKTNYRYAEKLAPLNWSIKKKTKVINGLHCQLATTRLYGKEFEAWFTEEIPLQEGPYKFYGLPGLIVEVYDQSRSHHFLLSGNESSCTYVEGDKEIVYIDVKREEYLKAVRRYYESVTTAFSEAGMQIHVSAEQKKKMDQEMQIVNNLIEME